jgi:hypothetical protein
MASGGARRDMKLFLQVPDDITPKLYVDTVLTLPCRLSLAVLALLH